MAKPLKFYQTLKQAPRSAKQHGKHRRAGAPAYGHSFVGADHGTGGSDQSHTIYTVSHPGWITWIPEPARPEPPAVPFAGIRTGEVIGYRLWWVTEGQLCSLAHRRVWLPDETIHGDTKELVQYSALSGRTIWGGTYAFLDRAQANQEADELRQYMDECRLIERVVWLGYQPVAVEGFAIGTIKLWGDVIEHERGYRAEFAKLNSIDAVEGERCDLSAIRSRYGVEPSHVQ